MGRSTYESMYGPCRNENPGDSKIRVLLDTVPPKGQGFLDNGNQSRVSRF